MIFDISSTQCLRVLWQKYIVTGQFATHGSINISIGMETTFYTRWYGNNG